MKFLHTADLHLGKRMNEVSLLKDQSYVLKQIIAAAIEEEVDGVLIAGDVYQKTTPSAEAMTLLGDFLAELAAHHIRVYMISGNHDSPQRVSYLSPLLKDAGIYISHSFSGRPEMLELEDQYGALVLYFLPYIKPVQVKSLYPEENIQSYQDAMKVILKHTPVDPAVRNILICHQYIAGAEVCDSEEIMIGGLEQIDGRLFHEFDYAAMGHIHKAQKTVRETMRYAGSPLKYSFSEVNHKKSVTIVDIKEKGSIEIHLRPLSALHEVRLLEGSLKQILEMDPSEDYVGITVTDEQVPPDARIMAAALFPNMMRFGIRNSEIDIEEEITQQELFENKSMDELFCDFYKMQNQGKEPSDECMTLLRKLMDEMKEEDA